LKILLISNDRFVTSSSDKTIKYFDLNFHKCIKIFIGHEGAVLCIDKSINDRKVSCSGYKTIRIWNLNSGKVHKRLASITVYLDKIISVSYVG
jgi:WD40 repeat protein